MYLNPIALLVALLLVAVCVLAGLVNAVLHHADGATLPATIRAGARASLTVAGVLLAAAAVAVAAWAL